MRVGSLRQCALAHALVPPTHRRRPSNLKHSNSVSETNRYYAKLLKKRSGVISVLISAGHPADIEIGQIRSKFAIQWSVQGQMWRSETGRISTPEFNGSRARSKVCSNRPDSAEACQIRLKFAETCAILVNLVRCGPKSAESGQTWPSSVPEFPHTSCLVVEKLALIWPYSAEHRANLARESAQLAAPISGAFGANSTGVGPISADVEPEAHVGPILEKIGLPPQNLRWRVPERV